MLPLNNVLRVASAIPVISLVLGCGDGTTEVQTGSLEVSTITAGSTIDSDGYTVTVDGSESQSVGVNASTTLTGLTAGDHDVELTGVASNCAVDNPNPRTVTVSARATASTTFNVSCALVLSDKIAFSPARGGIREIFVMDADGSNPVRLTNDPAEDLNPDWSPDGTRIAFVTNRDGNYEIYLMDADGSNPVNLTNDPEPDFDPDWSP